MSRFDCIAFDLDGTLSDPSVGLVTGFCYGLSRMGVDYGAKESLRRFIGPPLFEAWCSEFGFTREECDRAIALFREYYTVYGWRENTVYAGIYELLDRLLQAGKTLVVATSKPEEQARKIIRLFGMDKYFAYVGGAVSHHERATKAEVLKYSLESAGVKDFSRVILMPFSSSSPFISGSTLIKPSLISALSSASNQNLNFSSLIYPTPLSKT